VQWKGDAAIIENFAITYSNCSAGKIAAPQDSMKNSYYENQFHA
jgi:hypothetical protein